jgi:hypothetical protein
MMGYTRSGYGMSFQNGMACAADAAQTEPMTATQVRNSAGGYVFAVDDMTRLRRFCILGAEGGTYYASERQLKLENAQAVVRLVESGRVAEAVGELVAVSEAGRAPTIAETAERVGSPARSCCC